MMKFIMLLVAVLSLQYNVVSASNKSCAVIPFSDITFYAKELKTNELYADLVLEKVINDNLFTVKETYVIEDEKVRLLMDGSYANAKKMQNAMSADNFDSIFDSGSFNNEATDIKYAVLGQTVSPEIIKEIGTLHQVDYLLHGTVCYLGVGSDNHDTTNGLINAAGGALKFFTGIDTGKVNISSKGVKVVCDLRLIDVATGKVVWYDKSEFMSKKKNVDVGGVTVGTKTYNSGMYFDSVNRVAQVNIDDLVKEYAMY